ncbi:3'(2'),5'-bisphosphate nucleotidase CysQ [Mesorhizobium sp. RP14(2022)]|uniref:3'(2'),5'-bisphosphate nucleotidase CysQ n=1 Tax=Mesorhizobium liriopis TaxID=2953882 RepID=A0ABT1C0W1_9HYPH|nr:3'(2'),5'-bisphosphate nucleotidase CysQ [Mesorhizobium liriopis]MCO6048462.1 3'(2'),5'-bisphosphate nucleotidase CysQ [Mesorhizobium liriopis]
MPEADTHSDALRADLALLTEAAREAGRIAHGFFRHDPQVWMKEGVSPVSEADYASDKYLRETLLGARPGHGWLSEETVDSPERLARRRTFVVDPIDGTRAFVQGLDIWCVSVALVENGETLVGVLECPALRETFTAVKGGGAFLNGKLLHVRPSTATPTIAGPKQYLDALPEPYASKAHRHGHIPSLAYRIGLIAKGKLDATFVKPNSHDWDLAAADLILREAGGALLDTDGLPLRYATTSNPRHGLLVAGSGPLLAVAAETLKRLT